MPASPDAVPSARTVLIKAYDARGLVVFTNLTSRKAREALANPVATLTGGAMILTGLGVRYLWPLLNKGAERAGGVA